MRDNLSVLLVHDQEETSRALDQTLLNQGMGTRHVHTCSEVDAALRGAVPPQLILTEATLVDGSWEDVVKLAYRAGKPIPTIVVSSSVDIALYLTALEGGAADFIVLPVSAADLGYVVTTAIKRSGFDATKAKQRAAAT